ncbi:Cell division protein BolA [Rubellimicrobium mesophilum DSM 19309]|uniref:Cell division protein BolA n=1 Tax=Rubellimicrobium mesophilum DSM 19309 TaxID=442562 RepID=A0A017HS02_9RHOB|nr:BolA family protein [Rubellimicrobium mesophilum]EYD77156.1 Cell division protein BolA [Rubellimicrobium mesophilum DSM 19309]
MSIADEIRQRLESAFQPSRLDVLDESEGHRGHAGWREGGETHWRIRIDAPALANLSRVQRHRAVHAALGPEIIGRIHALALEVGA